MKVKAKFQEKHAHYGGDYGGDGDDGDGGGGGGENEVEGQGKVTKQSHLRQCHEGSVAKWMTVEPA